MKAFQSCVHSYMHESNMYVSKDSKNTLGTADSSNQEEPIPAFLKAITASQDKEFTNVEDTLQDILISSDSDQQDLYDQLFQQS